MCHWGSLQEGVRAEFPDVDVALHVCAGGDVVGGEVGRRGRVREGAVVPPETVDEVLEFVDDGEGDVLREGEGGCLRCGGDGRWE